MKSTRKGGSGTRSALPDGGARRAAVRVKTAKLRTSSSTRWLARQLNDPFVAAARERGYRSRAAFKLIELDERFHLFKPGGRVVDLGAAPGGWSQVAARGVKAAEGRGRVVAIDLLPVEPMPGVIVLDVNIDRDDSATRILEALEGPADVVLSDMAAPASGHRASDHLRVVALCEVAFALAETLLAPGGAFVAKVFQGGAEASLLAALKRSFREVRHVKPKASRAESAELYLVARGYRGQTPRI